MKKFFTSIALIFLFAIYTIHQRLSITTLPLPAAKLPTVINSTQPTSKTSDTALTPPTPAQATPHPAPSPAATPQPSAPSSGMMGNRPMGNQMTRGAYRDGTYTGVSADAYYGNVQVQATIQNGKLTDVQFLDYPHDRGTSIEINSQAMPYLKSEAIAAQSSLVDIVSGATETSQAFIMSLRSALAQAS